MNQDQPQSLSIRAYLAIVWRWRRRIVGATLVAATLAFVLSLLMRPVYEASAALVVGQTQTTDTPDYNTLLLNEQLARTYSQLLTDKATLREVAKRLNLRTDDTTLSRLAGAASVETVKDTQLVRVRVRDTNPTLAADIANTTLQVFIEQHETSLTEGLNNSLNTLKSEMDALQGRTDSTQRSYDEEKAKPKPDQYLLSRLDAVLKQYRATYNSFQQGYEELQAAQAHGASLLAIFNKAEPPTAPVLPRTKLNILLASLIGAMASTGMALLIEYLDDTVRRTDDVERASGEHVVATIGRLPKGQPGESSLIAAAPGAPAAEGYRMLRTDVELFAASSERPTLVLLVTGVRHQVGTTTVLSNLAVSLALIGRRVLAVDTNLRRPGVHRLFGLRNAAGFTSPFLEGSDVGAAIQATRIDNLRVLTAGPGAANPAELLSFSAAAGILGQLRDQADYVLLDSPPILGSADARTLAHRCDGVLLVTDAGRTSTADLQRATRVLQRARVPLVGIVLNRAQG